MRNKTIAMASALLVGGLLTLSSTAFADGNTAVTSTPQQIQAHIGQRMDGKMGGFGHKGEKAMFNQGRCGENISNSLKDLVTAGTISQATADKITAYQTEQEAAMKAEMDKLQAQHQAAQQATLKTSIDQLVTDKTITQEQAAKITEYMSKQQADRAAEMDKIKAMTQTERDAYFKTHTPVKTNMLAQLVTDKVLTQEQANTVEKALHPRGFGKGHGPEMQKGFRGNGAPRL